MKLHTFAGLGLALASSVVLAQTGALPAAPVGGTATGATLGAPATGSGTATGTGAVDQAADKNGLPKAPIGVMPNNDGTLGGTVNGGANGVSGAASGTLDPKNKSGSVASQGRLANEKFGKLDVDSDGSLSREELRGDAKLMSRFNKLDTNGDGKVDQNEYAMSAKQTLPSTGKKDTRSRSDKAKDTAKKNNQPSDVLPGG